MDINIFILFSCNIYRISFFFPVDYTIRTKVDEKINKIKKTIFIALDIQHDF